RHSQARCASKILHEEKSDSGQTAALHTRFRHTISSERCLVSAGGFPYRISKGSHLRRDRNLALVLPRPDRGCLHAYPTSLPPQIMPGQPLLGPNTGVHKTLIYNI